MCLLEVPEAMIIKSVKELMFLTLIATGFTAFMSSKLSIILFFKDIVIFYWYKFPLFISSLTSSKRNSETSDPL